MKEQIQNIIKNVIEENAVQFKDQTNNVLYSKVGDRLKQEYIDVSKNLFKQVNESVYGSAVVTDLETAGPPAQGTPNQGSPNQEVQNPGPAPQKPVRFKGESPEDYEKRLNGYYRAYEQWKKDKIAYEEWRITRANQRPLGGQGEPKHRKPKK